MRIIKHILSNIRFMTINRISDKDLDATFNFNARTDDSTKTISLSSGAVRIDYLKFSFFHLQYKSQTPKIVFPGFLFSLICDFWLNRKLNLSTYFIS